MFLDFYLSTQRAAVLGYASSHTLAYAVACDRVRFFLSFLAINYKFKYKPYFPPRRVFCTSIRAFTYTCSRLIRYHSTILSFRLSVRAFTHVYLNQYFVFFQILYIFTQYILLVFYSLTAIIWQPITIDLSTYVPFFSCQRT